MIFRKKRTNFLFLLINRFFYLSLSGGWTQKVGGTNDSLSPPLKKVGGSVSPPSYAHGIECLFVELLFNTHV